MGTIAKNNSGGGHPPVHLKQTQTTVIWCMCLGHYQTIDINFFCVALLIDKRAHKQRISLKDKNGSGRTSEGSPCLRIENIFHYKTGRSFWLKNGQENFFFW